MRTISYLMLLSAACLALWAADKTITLNVKPGLWEVTMITSTTGQMPIPAGMLERLTPEQRARFEERMKSQSSQSKPVTYKRCLTQEDLNKGFSLDERSCNPTMISSTSSRVDVKLDCLISGMKVQGRGQFEAVDSEDVKGQIQSSATNGDHTMSANTNYTAKWIGSACGNTK